MREHRNLWIFLIVYAFISFALFSWMDISISNGYQRSTAGAYISECVKSGNCLTFDQGTLLTQFTEGHRHYKIFSGFAAWQPLQLILLTFFFFIFGTGKFALTLLPLLITLITLMYIYFVTLFAYGESFGKKHASRIALLAVILTALSTLFLFEAASPMLENGLALFSIATIYHFARWLRSDEKRQFYLCCFLLGLGVAWKLTIVLVFPSLALAFFFFGDWKKKLVLPKTYKLFGIGVLFFMLAVSPLIIRDAALANKGLDETGERNLSRFHFFLPQDLQKPGFVSAKDFEFYGDLSPEKMDLVYHRYELSYIQKSFVTLSSLFFNWILLPFFLFALFRSRKWWKLRAWNEIELMLGIFVVVNIVFHAMHGLIPRYMIPACVVVAIFAARGIAGLKQTLQTGVATLVVLALVVMNASFFAGVYQNEHGQAMQHDYEGTAKFLLSNASGPFTVVTSRQYEMAFYLLQHDTDRLAYIELLPEKQTDLVQLLNGNFSQPALVKESSVSYNATLPRVRYVVIHEKLETGPFRGLANYNAKTFMDSYPGVIDHVEIPSSFPNARTWVYTVESNT